MVIVLSAKVAEGVPDELIIDTGEVGPVMKEPPAVNAGLIILAFAFNAVCVGVDTGLLASVVLSTLPSPTAALDTPPMVPVKVGLSSGAFDARLLVTVPAKLVSSFSAVASSFSVVSVAGAESIRSVNFLSTSAVEYVLNLE